MFNFIWNILSVFDDGCDGDFGYFGQIWGDLRQIFSKVEVTQIFLRPPDVKQSLYSSNIA